MAQPYTPTGDDAWSRARITDPLPSHEAANAIDVQQLEDIAWMTLKRHGGWVTYFQWSAISGIKYASITPRGKSLLRKGLVEVKIDFGFNDLGVYKKLMHFRALTRDDIV